MTVSIQPLESSHRTNPTISMNF